MADPIDAADFAPENSRPLRVWPIVLAASLYWIIFFALDYLEDGLKRFMGRLAAAAVLTLLFTFWWLLKRKVVLKERLLVLAWAVAVGALALAMRDPSFKVQFIGVLLLYTVPPLITGWTLWLLAIRRSSAPLQRLGLIGIPVVMWGAAAAVRFEGLTGIGNPDIRLRWTRPAEQQFLAERVSLEGEAHELAKNAQPLVPGPHDWTEFRGPNRDSALHGVKIATNWDEAPPKLVWRRRVGPGWSSITVVANRLFTQEQRGENEAVVSFDAKTGEEIWFHEDKARFSEDMGGDGPRATPTFADGKIYALGATGILNCLDAANGELKWTQNIAGAPKAKPPGEANAPPKEPAAGDKQPETGMPPMYWGYASSPLVVDGVVIVFRGGNREDSLLAYNADTGEPAWKADSGTHSYSSPQLATFGGKKQVLFLSDQELTSIDPATGRALWRYKSAVNPARGFPAIQPHIVGPAEVLVSFSSDTGTMLLKVASEGEDWNVTEQRETKGDFHPYFNDFVVYEGNVYGFKPPQLWCVDPHTGERLWKAGRYGAGQVLLLADQGVLLVITEKGEAVLVAADPKDHRELGRFQAIDGKTWNHPTIVDSRLYIRNAEEMACYELPLK